MQNNQASLTWVLLRFSMAFVMLWAFFDKTFGLGYATPPDKAWLHSASPTTGFLANGTHGTFAPLFQGLAGNPLIDWLFMLGLLLIGMSLLLGIGVKIAGYSGALLMLLLYLAVFPAENNPLIDEHIIYILVFLGLRNSQAGQVFGLGKWWSNTTLVKHYSFLQ